MSVHRLLLAMLLMLPCGAMAMASEEQQDVEFEGYSRNAEMIVEKLLRAVGKLTSYSDDGIMKMETGTSFVRQEQPITFVYAKPRRFHLELDTTELISNGKELTVYMKTMRRYKVAPLEKDLSKQLRKYRENMQLTVGGLVLAKDPKKRFAEAFKNLEVTGEETIDDDRCIVLEGTTESTRMGLGDTEIPVFIYLRKSDTMIRRIETDLLEAFKKQFEDNDSFVLPFKEYKLVYDVRDIRINEPVEEGRFAFEPPSGAKKVDHLYAAEQATEGAVQFELSGKKAPDFELETTGGEWVSLSSLEGLSI